MRYKTWISLHREKSRMPDRGARRKAVGWIVNGWVRVNFAFLDRTRKILKTNELLAGDAPLCPQNIENREFTRKILRNKDLAAESSARGFSVATRKILDSGKLRAGDVRLCSQNIGFK